MLRKKLLYFYQEFVFHLYFALFFLQTIWKFLKPEMTSLSHEASAQATLTRCMFGFLISTESWYTGWVCGTTEQGPSQFYLYFFVWGKNRGNQENRFELIEIAIDSSLRKAWRRPKDGTSAIQNAPRMSGVWPSNSEHYNIMNPYEFWKTVILL